MRTARRAADDTAITVTVTPDDLPAFTFTLNFGAAGSFAGVTSLLNNATSQLQSCDRTDCSSAR